MSGLFLFLTACEERVVREGWDDYRGDRDSTVEQPQKPKPAKETPVVKDKRGLAAKPTPPPDDPKAPAQLFDLRNSPVDAVYTLEIGKYNPEFGEDYRKAAEVAVAALRKEGVEAYYYHDENDSPIMLGAFPNSALRVTPQGQVEILDPKLRQLQEQYPNYQLNSQQVRIKVPSNQGQAPFETLRSRLVEIPPR